MPASTTQREHAAQPPLAERLLARWYGDRPAPWLLRPLALLYRAVVALRVLFYRRGWLARIALPVPVIVVGNVSLGGTGKTPLVVALVEALRERGWQPGVVSRGYGGREDAPVLLDADADPASHGDEPCLIHQRTGVAVAVGRDRAAAGRLLVELGVDVVIADDGLQHYRLGRDIEICVIDGSRRFGNGWMLPAGPLRELPGRCERADFRVCNGGLPLRGEVAMRLLAKRVRSVSGAAGDRPLQDFSERRVHAVAGIGNPSRFFDSLRAQRIEVIEHPFPDHHPYTRHDLDFDDDLPVLMTEKDAVKCRAFACPEWWAVPVDAVLPESFVEALAARLAGVRRHRSQEPRSHA